MPSVFISYSRTDKTIADYIGTELRARGADVFIDYQALVGGENFIGRLGREIESRDHFVLLLSPRSVVSKWVQAEAAWALRSNKPIIPVILEPASLADFFFLIPLEQIDFTRWSVDGKVDEAIQKLSKTLELPARPIHAEPVREPMTSPLQVESEANHKTESTPPAFARSDLSELFITAADIAPQDPEQAVFLYRRVIEIDPDFMQGKAKAFLQREEQRLKPARLANMLAQAQAAMRAGEWNRGERIGRDMLLLEQDNADAQRVVATCVKNAEGEPVYQHAVVAAKAKRWRAVATLLRDVRENCPEYGDPSNLIASGPFQIDSTTVTFLREFANWSGHTSGTHGVAFSPDGKILASGGNETMIRLWDVATRQQIVTLPGHASATHGVAFSPDGKILASGGGEAMIKLWDVATRQQIAILPGHASATYGVAFSPDGTVLVSGGNETMIRFWDVATGQQIATLPGHLSTTYGVAFSPNGTVLASGGGEAMIRLWDVATLQQIAALAGHASATYGVAFSPDGKLLASGGGDAMIKLWDVATRQQIATLPGHAQYTWGVAFSPDGKLLASGGGDAMIKLWRIV